MQKIISIDDTYQLVHRQLRQRVLLNWGEKAFSLKQSPFPPFQKQNDIPSLH